MPYDTIAITHWITSAPKKPRSKKWPGWEEITNLASPAQTGDVACRLAYDPGLYVSANRYPSFRKGITSGFVIGEQDAGINLCCFPMKDCFGRKARVWRRKRTMNPIYSKPLPLP